MVRYSGGGVACDFEGRDQESIQDILAAGVEKGRSGCWQAFVDERRIVGCVTCRPFQAALLCDALALVMFLSRLLYLFNLVRKAGLL
jgi:hypothetical protein